MYFGNLTNLFRYIDLMLLCSLVCHIKFILQAYVISHIAQFDWPDEWPGLFETLIAALNSGNNNIIHGAMRVFAG